MQGIKMAHGALLGLILLGVAMQSDAGQTPGVATPWNGPWGGGYLNGGAYAPWSSPYISAGYPIAAPDGYAANPANAGSRVPQPQYLPGGGYLLPPGAGGGMLPGAYNRQ
jgi:hypothetical protein